MMTLPAVKSETDQVRISTMERQLDIFLDIIGILTNFDTAYP
jgi:hypothetical protein